MKKKMRIQPKRILLVLVVYIISAVLAADLCETPNASCTSECKQRGFLDDKKACRIPTINECKEDPAGCANALSGENKACKVLGMEKNTSDDACHIPISCTASGKQYCSDPQKPCVKNGYVKSQTGTDCVAPQLSSCRDGSSKCFSDDYACVILGFGVDSSGKCLEPDCRKASACKDPKVVCTSLGFTKNDDDTCSCEKPLQIQIKSACHTCESETQPCIPECIEIGWATKDKKCVEPDQCDDQELSHCSRKDAVCPDFFGFTKLSDSDACECIAPKIVRYNRCVSLSYSNIPQLLFSISTLILFIFI